MLPALALLATKIVFGILAETQASVQSISLLDTFLVILMAVGVNLLYAVGRRKLTDVEKMRRYNAEMKAFRSEMSSAVKEGNKQKQEKLKKKQQQMNKMQMEMSKEQLKPTLLFMAPLWGVYYVMQTFVVPCNATTCVHVAVFPFAIPFFSSFLPIMPFFWWYLICSFAFSGIISRVFGLTFD